MGYLIQQSSGDLIKVETFIKAGSMQTLATNPYPITPTVKSGFTFVPVSVFLQVNGTTGYNAFSHIWLKQNGSSPVCATFNKTGSNYLTLGGVASFIVNIDHGTTPTNQFGVSISAARDFELIMNIDDTTGDGDGFLTIYGYYLPTI